MAHTDQRQRYQLTFAVLLAGVTAYSLLQSLVLPVLPTIQENLHTSQDTVTWVLTAYLVSASVFTPILGRFGDIAGKKRMFVVALAALALGSLLGALAPSIAVMIVARAIQGIGGGVLPLAFGIVRDECPREKVSSAIGITAGISAAGAGIGIALTGPIVGVLDYHWLFWIPMIMVTAAGVAAYKLIPETPMRRSTRINWPAAIALSGWLVALLIAISEGPNWGWTSPRVLALTCVSLVLIVIWIRIEVRATDPLIDMRMMRLRTVWTTNLVAFLFGVGLYAIFAFVPAFVQAHPSAGYGFSASVTESGFYLVPFSVTMFLLGLVCGRLVQAVGGRIVLVAGSAIIVVAFAMLSFANNHSWEIYVALTIFGAGSGLAYSAMSIVIVEAVPMDQTSVASGMNANVRTIGGAVGAAAMASIVTSGIRGRALPPLTGYEHGFEMLAFVTILAAGAGILVPSMTRSTEAREEGTIRDELAVLALGPLAENKTTLPGTTITSTEGTFRE